MSSVQCSAPRHGDRTAARYGCRCPEARRARRLYEAARTAGRPWLVVDQPVEATGARRRIRALYAMGWTERELAGRLGYRGRTICWMHRRQRIAASMAAAVRELADELGMVAGPSWQLRARAASWGWVTMLAWEGVDIDDPNAQPLTAEPDGASAEVDEVAVERAVAGAPPAGLTRAERRRAVAVLRRQGTTVAESARRLRVSERVVQQDRLREVVPA